MFSNEQKLHMWDYSVIYKHVSVLKYTHEIEYDAEPRSNFI